MTKSPTTPENPYAEARASMTALRFAEFVLNDAGLLKSLSGIEFVNGKVATPLLKMREANRVLKSLGLPQIDQSTSWLV